MHRERLKGILAKPGPQLGNMFAAGVVEVLSGGKDFYALRARPGSEFQQSRVQALVEEQVRGQDSQHDRGISRIRQPGVGAGRYSDCRIF
jgi:hypothetical protein